MQVNQGLWPWLFQRVSAAFLVIGLAVHFLVLHFMIERPVTMAKVAERLQAPGWMVFDSLLLLPAAAAVLTLAASATIASAEARSASSAGEPPGVAV